MARTMKSKAIEKAKKVQIKRIGNLMTQYERQGYTVDYSKYSLQKLEKMSLPKLKGITAKKVRESTTYYEPETGKKQTWYERHTYLYRQAKEHPIKKPKKQEYANSNVINEIVNYISAIPDITYVDNGVAYDHSEQKSELVELLLDAEEEADEVDPENGQTLYYEWLKSHYQEILGFLERVRGSKSADVDFAYTQIAEIIKGRPLTSQEKQDIEDNVNEPNAVGEDPELYE